MILVDRRAYHTNESNNNVPDTTMNDSTMMMMNLQQQRFHDSTMAEQHHGPIRVGNYAVQQPRKGFKGDSEDHVDELISACAQHNNSVKENRVIQEIGGLQMMKNERTLVPYFGGVEDDFSQGDALEWPVKGGRRKGGSQIVSKNNNGKKKGTGDQRKLDKGNGNPHKPQRQEYHENKHGHQHAHQRNKTKQQKSGKYAGPAFTVSPVPENIPMPSKLLS